MVHFMFHGSRDKKKILDRLLGALFDGKRSGVALDIAFKGVDLDEFQTEFKAYLSGL